jgi:asparaginyl-tRNA synthetase
VRKKLYVRDLLNPVKIPDGEQVELLGWIRSRRHHSHVVFVDVVDSTGAIQLVLNETTTDETQYGAAKSVPIESAIRVAGTLNTSDKGQREIMVNAFTVISVDSLCLQPQPRAGFDIFDPKMAKHIIANKAVYLREPHYMAILRFRAKVMQIVREWFELNGFLEFDAPILVLAPLYDDSTAMKIDVHGQDVFLSQCAGFFLEAATMAFEKVYNMGPSFRGEESRSKRHLKEYWHIKAELAFGDRDDIIEIVESLLIFVHARVNEVCKEEMTVLGSSLRSADFRAPFARITYEEAVKHVQSKGSDTKIGVGISSKDEEELAKLFDGPFWVLGIPRGVEPFPYVIDETNPTVTKVADLIAPRGYGELCGVAEKIFNPLMLNERMGEKGKLGDPRYDFVVDIHRSACVPHIAFGMGLERLLRWLLDIPHVRDTIPFPRLAGRSINH